MRYLASLVLLLSTVLLWSCTPDPTGALRADTDAVAADIAHAPLDLVVMLDTSMSMTRRQMALARTLLGHLIHMMNDADQFSLVLVADEASVAIESSYATSEAKTGWIERVDALEVSGLTNLEDALELTHTLAPGTRIVLVTDGSPTWGNVVADELAISAEGLDLWTVGVGRNNEELLRALGHYTYLDDPAELARVLITHDGKASQSREPEHRGH